MAGEYKERSCIVPIIVALIGAAATIIVAIINHSETSIFHKDPKTNKVNDRSKNPTNGNNTSANNTNTQTTPSNNTFEAPGTNGDNTSANNTNTQTTPINNTSEAPSNSSINTCEVLISKELVALREEPSPFAQRDIKVPNGRYKVITHQIVTHAGKPFRWFKIRVGEKEGWIPDDTWTIDNKFGNCP